MGIVVTLAFVVWSKQEDIVMDNNAQIDEAIDYAKWMLKNLNPDDMYNYKEVRRKILEMIGYLTTLKN